MTVSSADESEPTNEDPTHKAIREKERRQANNVRERYVIQTKHKTKSSSNAIAAGRQCSQLKFDHCIAHTINIFSVFKMYIPFAVPASYFLSSITAFDICGLKGVHELRPFPILFLES